jgi:hypothetical protein
MSIKNKFCHHCGIKLVPTAKFCPDCGTSQSSLGSKPPVEEVVEVKPKKRPQSTFTPVSRGEGDDDDDDSYIDHIDHLDISMSALEIDYIRQDNPSKESFGSIVQQGASLPQNAENFTRGAPPQVDQQAFLQQFKNEAGSLRQK